jgi:hypothetical protein
MAKTGGGLARKAGAVVNAPGTGRFMESDGLTDQQAAFVAAYVANGAKATQAAIDAGYQSPHSEGWRLMQNPAIKAAIHAEADKRLAGAGAIGIGVLVDIARDVAAPTPSRVSAAKWLAEAAGHGLAARKAGEHDGEAKPLEEMTAAELVQAIAGIGGEIEAMKQQRQDEARTIDVAPIVAPKSEPIDAER